mgnify:CR=1 FL=1
MGGNRYANAQSGTIVKEYLRRFPNVATRALARKIYNENKLLFRDYEGARATVNYYRGKLGSSKGGGNRHLESNEFYKEKNFSIMDKENRFGLPASHAGEKGIFEFGVRENKVLVLSDLHIPYHDIKALTAALEFGKEKGCNAILLNGDIIDCCLLSKFEKNPKARSFKEEVIAVKEFFEVLRKLFPKAKIVWLKGNHDMRYEKFLYSKCAEIFDDTYDTLEQRLDLKKYRIELLDEGVLVHVGKLMVTHGHLMIRGVFAPVNPARGIFLRAKDSLLIGHCHQVSEHTERTLGDKVISCWSTGCLCTLNQHYDPHNTKHSHGFAYIEVKKDGEYNVYNKRIIKGKIV